MSDETEVYSKAVVDQYFQGIYSIVANVLRIVLEDRITDGRSTREDTAAMLTELARVVENPAAKVFYDSMAENVERTVEPGSGAPAFTVIDGGRSDT